jgi:RNA polymerase sigma-70 factor, ECF subfamily
MPSSSSSLHDDLLALLPRLRVQALALTSNRAEADDLLHDAVVNILAGQGGFTPGTNFAAWAHRILRNRFLSLVRRRREIVGIEDIPPPAVAGAQADSLAIKELERALARLPAEQREVLFMVALRGMCYDEVAEATGVALGTAKGRVFRARRFLHAWLEGDGGPADPAGPTQGHDGARARPSAGGSACRGPCLPARGGGGAGPVQRDR